MEENEVKEVVETKKGKKKRPFDVTVKIYMIVSTIIYVIWTAYIGYAVISASLSARTGDSEVVIGWIFFFIFVVICIGFIGYGIMTFIGITGLVLSIANKDNPKRIRNIVFFIVETSLAVGTYFALIYLGAGIVNS
ncbi:MAG: hypothetical protein J5666_06370 [Bacilli bacterium]|nr:hypothetical protein [Bacilli bacterium]